MKKNFTEIMVEFFADGGSNHEFIQRLGAAFFGSLLFHATLILLAGAKGNFLLSDEWYYSSALLFFMISVIFGLIISTGKKGGLIRRFWYGVSLPGVCYFLAISIYSLFTGIN